MSVASLGFGFRHHLPQSSGKKRHERGLQSCSLSTCEACFISRCRLRWAERNLQFQLFFLALLVTSKALPGLDSERGKKRQQEALGMQGVDLTSHLLEQ